MKKDKILQLVKFCRFLAETEESFTEDFPGLHVTSYLESWSAKNPDSTLSLPESLVEAPFIKAATKMYDGELCIFGVYTEELLAWLVAHGTISPEMKELVLAKLTLHLMDD